MRIAIIATKYVHEYIKTSLESFNLDCTFSYHVYQTFHDLISIYEEVSSSCEGIIASGYYPMQIIRKHFPNSKLVLEQFNVDDADLYQFLLRLLQDNRNWDISRIYADFLDIIDTDLEQYINEDRTCPYTQLQMEKYKDYDEKALLELEDIYYERHLALWEAGKVDMCLTRFSSLVTPLKSEGVNIHFPYPSKEYLLQVYNETAKNIMINQLRSALPAVVAILIKSNENMSDIAFDKRCADLYFLSQKYRDKHSFSFSVHKSRQGLEIITDTKALEQITNDYKETPYADFIKNRIDFDIYIGYGLGNTVYEAKKNAHSAVDESAHFKGEKSFIFAPRGKRIGPLENAQAITIEGKYSEAIEAAAKKSGLSALTIEKVTKAVQNSTDEQITAKELSGKLGITVRSANRILSALLHSEYLELAGENKVFTKGRPERVYALKN